MIGKSEYNVGRYLRTLEGTYLRKQNNVIKFFIKSKRNAYRHEIKVQPI